MNYTKMKCSLSPNLVCELYKDEVLTVVKPRMWQFHVTDAFNKEKRPTLNTQNDSIPAKLCI